MGSLPAAHGGDATAGTRPRPLRDRVASCPWRDDRSTAARSRLRRPYRRRVATGLLDLLLPQRCVACGLPGAQVCDACLVALPRLRGPRCERCCAPTAWPVRRCRECAGRRLAFARARSAVAYDEAVSRLVHAWKERGLRRLAAAAAEVTADALEHRGEPLVFVPPDPERRRGRGYHPAEALARELGARWDVPVLAVLARARGGARQRGLTLPERRANVRGAFLATRVATRRRAGRRRLHDGRDGQRRGLRTPKGRRAPRRGRDVRTRGSWVYSDDPGLTGPRGGRVATSGEGQEPRRHRLHPQLCRAEAQEARQAAERRDRDRARARRREEPVDRREPDRRGDRLDEGPDAARARSLRGHARLDRPADREARPPGPALPRQAELPRRAQSRSRRRRSPGVARRPAGRSRSSRRSSSPTSR